MKKERGLVVPTKMPGMNEAIFYTTDETSLQLSITRQPSSIQMVQKNAQQRLLEFLTHKVMRDNKNGQPVTVGIVCHSAIDSQNNHTALFFPYLTELQTSYFSITWQRELFPLLLLLFLMCMICLHSSDILIQWVQNRVQKYKHILV